MPLLHQETRGESGGERRRSLMAEYLGYEPPRPAPGPPPPHAHALTDHESRGGGGGGCGGGAGEWRWEEPGSPELAQSPRALVPPACFPPRYPRAFASFSESARPGGGWDEAPRGITDLVASLKALALPVPRLDASIQMRLSIDRDTNEPWGGGGGGGGESPGAREERALALARRASFCGVVSAAEGGGGGGGGGGAVRWSGVLPAREGGAPEGGYSAKVFMGGLPWDISEHALLHALRHFHPVRVEWPGREAGAGGGAGGGGAGGGGGPRGFAYVTLESERRVRALLAASRRDHLGDYYFRVASRKMRSKDVQVIPWHVSDVSWVAAGGGARLEPARTVFVGALHGMLTARALAHIMDELFHGVVYAGIDTDKSKYPIGSGRVTFDNVRSYVRAVSAAFVEIHTDKFSKKVQVDPYLEDSMCSLCDLRQGPYFCREPSCFRYFCRSCWAWRHGAGAGAGAGGGEGEEEHRPLMRSSKARLEDHSAVYPAIEGAGSPSTSGTSGTSEPEPADEAPELWAPPPPAARAPPPPR